MFLCLSRNDMARRDSIISRAVKLGWKHELGRQNIFSLGNKSVWSLGTPTIEVLVCADKLNDYILNHRTFVVHEWSDILTFLTQEKERTAPFIPEIDKLPLKYKEFDGFQENDIEARLWNMNLAPTEAEPFYVWYSNLARTVPFMSRYSRHNGRIAYLQATGLLNGKSLMDAFYVFEQMKTLRQKANV